MRLTPQSAQSYAYRGDLDALIARLVAQGWRRDPPRSPHELARLWRGRAALIVVYRTGTLLIQGPMPEMGHAALRRAAGDDPMPR